MKRLSVASAYEEILKRKSMTVDDSLSSEKKLEKLNAYDEKFWRNLEFLKLKTEHKITPDILYYLCIDGKNIREGGRDAFDKSRVDTDLVPKGTIEEPGFIDAMETALMFTIMTLNVPLSLELITAIHHLAVSNVKRECGAQQKVESKYVTYSELKEQLKNKSCLVCNGSMPEYWVNKKCTEAQRNRSIEEILKWQDIYGDFKVQAEKHGPDYLIQRFIDDYNSDLQLAGNYKDKIRVAIAKFIKKFNLLHPYGDGHVRTCYLLCNKLLLENGLSPTMINNPIKVFCGYSSSDIAKEIKWGQELWKKNCGRKQEDVEMSDYKEAEEKIDVLVNQKLHFREAASVTARELEIDEFDLSYGFNKERDFVDKFNEVFRRIAGLHRIKGVKDKLPEDLQPGVAYVIIKGNSVEEKAYLRPIRGSDHVIEFEFKVGWCGYHENVHKAYSNYLINKYEKLKKMETNDVEDEGELDELEGHCGAAEDYSCDKLSFNTIFKCILEDASTAVLVDLFSKHKILRQKLFWEYGRRNCEPSDFIKRLRKTKPQRIAVLEGITFPDDKTKFKDSLNNLNEKNLRKLASKNWRFAKFLLEKPLSESGFYSDKKYNKYEILLSNDELKYKLITDRNETNFVYKLNGQQLIDLVLNTEEVDVKLTIALLKNKSLLAKLDDKCFTRIISTWLYREKTTNCSRQVDKLFSVIHGMIYDDLKNGTDVLLSSISQDVFTKILYTNNEGKTEFLLNVLGNYPLLKKLPDGTVDEIKSGKHFFHDMCGKRATNIIEKTITDKREEAVLHHEEFKEEFGVKEYTERGEAVFCPEEGYSCDSYILYDY